MRASKPPLQLELAKTSSLDGLLQVEERRARGDDIGGDQEIGPGQRGHFTFEGRIYQARRTGPGVSVVPKDVIIYTCPTGGWALCTRFRQESEIRLAMPGCNIQHRVAYPLSAVDAVPRLYLVSFANISVLQYWTSRCAVEVDGKKKRFGVMQLICCPRAIAQGARNL